MLSEQLVDELLAAIGERTPASAAGSRASTLRDLELSPDVEAGILLEHVRRHRRAPPRLDARLAVLVARLGGVPHGEADDLVPVRGVQLVRAQHPGRELARLPRPAELLARAGLELPRRDPDVPAVEIHQP